MSERHERHPELSMVALAYAVESDDGLVPAGSKGTVVFVYPNEVAYEVEFSRPFHTVATVKAEAVRE